ncbi:SGNH hydrolase [Pholiota conissans]|uniref:SGNH hydrolase n=1 Tax=Pholiota conissans TaxID=109636 RepID=A0A9P5ZH45_9AGAR|nr:SGNH hydrolase [Pholiota conissans]
MAKGGGGNNTDGWGQYIGQYLSIPVVNMAIGGRSARSYSDEGRFTTIINTVKAGDFVVIEFGHNDGTSGTVDNGRQDAVGSDTSTTATVTTSSGTTLVIHTFNYYIDNAVNSLKAKGAIPIVSSQTPDNIWANATTMSGPSRFVGYAQIASTQTSVTYVDHFDYVATQYQSIGQATVNTYYPMDHTHTSATGANVVAQAFVRGLACGGSALSQKINSAGKSVPLIGKCI